MFRMIVCHFRENFSVNFNFLVGHFLDERAVFLAMHAKSRIEAQDPETPEGPFLHSAVAIGVFAGFEQSFLGGAKSRFSVPHEAFGGFQNFFSSFGGGYAAFDS